MIAAIRSRVRAVIKTCLDCRPGERIFAASMSASFFLVIATFWVLKPLKKAAFIEQFDVSGVQMLSWHASASEAELVAKVLNMVVALGAAAVFSVLARRFRRQQLVHIFAAFFILGFAAYSLALTRPSDATVWTFYLFGDLFSTLMVATFFAFLNDSVSPGEAKRLYGVVGLGGVAGGVVGSTFVSVWISAVPPVVWLWICVATSVAVMAAAEVAGRHALGEVRHPRLPEPPEAVAAEAAGSGGILEGARLVRRSRYLMAIVAMVALYELASTITDFMFTMTVTHYLTGPEIGRQFARVFAVTNWVSLLVQFFLTSLVMTRWGLTTALLILPAALFTGSAFFLVVPVLWTGSLLNTADNGFSYSINQSAREALYVPVSRREKYQAKAFIDMFVQRVAKAAAVVVSLAVSALLTEFEGLRWLGLLNAAIVVLWMVAARYAGRQFAARTAAVVALLSVATAASAQAPSTAAAEGPATRAGQYEAARRAKALVLTPERVGKWEGRMLALERRNFPESLFAREYNGVRGLIGGMPSGSGFVGGIGFMQGATGDRARLQATARVSTENYRQADAEVVLPTARSGRPFQVSLQTRYADYRALDVYPLGQDTPADRRGSYRFESGTFSAGLSGRVGRRLAYGMQAGVLDGTVRAVDGPPALRDLPGAADQPRFRFTAGQASVLLRDNELRYAGLTLSVDVTRWDGLDHGLFDFTRVAGEVQGHLPLGSRARMLALRVRASHAIADSGARVPFYLMETIGGARTLRGFDEYRFRDTRNLVANVEYRWEVWNYADLTVFADAGEVYSNSTPFSRRSLATSYGVGVRSVLPGGGGFRIDLARSREGFRLHIGGGPSF